MEELLTKYTLSEILIFLSLFGLTVKGFITFWDWAYARVKAIFDDEHEAERKLEKEKQSMENRFQHGEKIMETLTQNQKELIDQYNQLSEKLNMLIDSDKDSIKAFLTEKHHYFCYTKKWIDDYSLECCEKRFTHYRDEGGNSYIEGFMEDLRKLPNMCPSCMEEAAEEE